MFYNVNREHFFVLIWLSCPKDR